MKFKNEIYHIVLSGILLGLALVVGNFAHFPLFGGNVYLIGAIIFVMPLVLPIWYALVVAILAAALTDILTGWAAYCWITIIAYGLAVVIIWLFTLLKFKWIFLIGLSLAALEAMAVYFFLEWRVFDKAQAINDLAATAIEMAIVVPIASLLYWPLKLIVKK